MTERNEHHISINVENYANVSMETINNTSKAITLVLSKLLESGNEVNLQFVTQLKDYRGRVLNAAGAYDPDSNYISVCVGSDSFKSFEAAGLSQVEVSTLLGAHEATHKAQFDRGDNPSPSKDYEGDRAAYLDDENEREAWEEAVHVFKHIYPRARGWFGSIGRNFIIPNHSKYD